MTNPNYSYDGLVVTSIDCKSEPTEDRPNRITFTGYTPGNEAKRLSGDALKKHNEERKDAATFLWKCKHIGGADKDGKREYEADKLTNEEAHAEFVSKYGEGCKPLFSIHGFNNEPGYTFRESTTAQQKFNDGKNAIIPVVWPNYGGPAYKTDRSDNAPEASKELNMLVQHILGETGNLFKNKNLICHSMGNYVLRGAANPNIKFDNIFMVAADVRHNIFDKDYINRSQDENSENKDGLRIFSMLSKHESGDNIGKPKGKIYCLYNGSDYALGGSGYINWVNRAGQCGIGSYDSWGPGWTFDEKRLIHPDIYGYTENFNAYDKLPWKYYKAHSYQWMQFAIDYYKQKIEASAN